MEECRGHRVNGKPYCVIHISCTDINRKKEIRILMVAGLRSIPTINKMRIH